MKDYQRNIPKLYALRVLSGVVFANALIVPFFIERGLSQAEIMLLQSIFSVSVVLLEIPTGYVADHKSRKLSLQLATLAVTAGFFAYSLSEEFWQFAVCEVLLATGFALLSGAHEALFYDSLAAVKQQHLFRAKFARLYSLDFAMTAVAAPIGSVVAAHVGIAPVIMLDAVLALVGFMAASRLIEPPLQQSDEVGRHPVRNMLQVLQFVLRGNRELGQLILLGAVLSAATYFGFWLMPVYLTEAGVPLSLFGFVVAARSLFKAVLSHIQPRVTRHLSDARQLQLYAALSVVSYWLLSSAVHPIAAMALLGFDVVQALQGPVISDLVHDRTPSHIRAQVLSVMSLARRAAYALLGPLVGVMVDWSLQRALFLIGVLFAIAFVAQLRWFRRGGVQNT